eukprot:2958152-Alexandrium_andersonii.AAC.1
MSATACAEHVAPTTHQHPRHVDGQKLFQKLPETTRATEPAPLTDCWNSCAWMEECQAVRWTQK